MTKTTVESLNSKLEKEQNNNNNKNIKRIGTMTITAISMIATLGTGMYLGQKINIGEKIHNLLNSFNQNKQTYIKKDIHYHHHKIHHLTVKKKNVEKALKRYKHEDFKNLYKEIEKTQSYSDLIRNIQKLKQLNEIVKQNGNFNIKLDGKPIDQKINSAIGDLTKVMYINKCILDKKYPSTDDFLKYTAGILNSDVTNFSYQQFEKLKGKSFADKFLNGYKELIQKIQNDFEKTYIDNPKIPEKIKEHLRGKEFADSMTGTLEELNKLIKKQQEIEKTNEILGVDF